MRALVYLGPGKAELQERPIPTLTAPDDVRVRVIGSGICGTDRKILLGHFPAEPGVILGHESVGIVDACGPAVRSVSEGDRVVIDPTLYCGLCEQCRRGATNHCRNKRGTEVGVDRDGTFADYTVLPERFVHPLPRTLGFRDAVLIEPIACCLSNLRAGAMTADDVVLVLGAGPIGSLCALLAERTARRTVVCETDAYRLAEAGRRFRHVLDTSAGATPDTVRTATGGQLPSLVIDTTGVALEDAIRLVDDGGRIVVMGFNNAHRATLSPLHLTNHGISIIGAGDYRGAVFPSAIAHAAELRPESLVTHEFPLEAYPEAFASLDGVLPGGAAGPGYRAMKTVLRSSSGRLDAQGWPVDETRENT
ncbi:zinc-binding dehydrogenase [Kitasatospora sp. NPDC058218]|uniref:zinc-dependent alcohol dehydrogenase n=1 Tax=Kitasatospora sp. NPDC058218 TaxID=3346385 RepID=UPI0036DCC3CB